jgi:hypothetical protein
MAALKPNEVIELKPSNLMQCKDPATGVTFMIDPQNYKNALLEWCAHEVEEDYQTHIEIAAKIRSKKWL